ncbi:MAG: hypothetical protein JNN27_09600 [Planctomycetes bacterium]|nr:hypothetical protein [Planctomycetota bacterium]
MHTKLKSLVATLALASFAAPATAQLIVGAESNNSLDAVWRIDVASGERALLFYGGSSALAVDDAGGRIFSANFAQLSQWNYGGGPSATVLGNLKYASGALFRPAGLAYGGGRLFATVEDLFCTGWLFEIDLTTLVATPLPTTVCLSWVEALSFEPSTGEFVLQNDTDRLYRMDILGGGAPQLMGSIGFGLDGGALGTNGAYYVMYDQGGTSIEELDLATLGATGNKYWAPFYGTGDNAGADWAPSLVVPPGPRVYCEPTLVGSPPRPTYTGLPSASAGSGFTITHAPIASSSRVQPHISLVGPAQAPFLTGKRCLKLPVLRLPHAFVTSSVHSFDFNAYIASGVNPALVAGQSVWFQIVEIRPALDATTLGPGVSFTILP